MRTMMILVALLLMACSSVTNPKSLRLVGDEGKLDLTVKPNGDITDNTSGALVARINAQKRSVTMLTGQARNNELMLIGNPGAVWSENSDTYRIEHADFTFTVVGGEKVLFNGDPWGTVSGYDSSSEARMRFAALVLVFPLMDPPPDR